MEPRKIIFDTDIGGDCDDVVALDLLISAHRQGLCNLVGVSCTSMAAEGAGCARAVLTYRGMGELPLSAAAERERNPSYYGVIVSGRFPELARMEIPFPEPVKSLRRLIVENPGVCIIVVGDSTNMANLLRSEPDEISPLSGVELVRENVSFFAVMAGSFSWQNGTQDWGEKLADGSVKPHAEWNIICDRPAAAAFFEMVPVDVYVLPFEAGLPVLSGKVLADAGENCPDGLAIIAHGSANGRASWDPMTALFAVWGAEPWLTVSESGRITVDSEGVTWFEACPDGKHYVLNRALPEAQITQKIDGEIAKLL